MSLKHYYGELPKTMAALKALSPDKIKLLWSHYFQGGVPQLKPLWYKIQCERSGYAIEQRFLSRLHVYSRDPEGCSERSLKVKYRVKPGTRLIKKFKGKDYVVDALSEKAFLYNGKVYSALSTIAREITGRPESGYNFFGFNNKGRDYDRTANKF